MPQIYQEDISSEQSRIISLDGGEALGTKQHNAAAILIPI
jgi:hypothetical protein